MKLLITKEEMLSIVRAHLQLEPSVEILLTEDAVNSKYARFREVWEKVQILYPHYAYNQRIVAIRYVRERIGCGLGEAKRLVEYPAATLANLKAGLTVYGEKAV